MEMILTATWPTPPPPKAWGLALERAPPRSFLTHAVGQARKVIARGPRGGAP